MLRRIKVLPAGIIEAGLFGCRNRQRARFENTRGDDKDISFTQLKNLGGVILNHAVREREHETRF